MKNLVSIHILCLLFLIACANNNNQIPKLLSSSYDGIWDGYLESPDGQQYIKIGIKNGIVSGFFEHNGFAEREVQGRSGEKEINGYITSENILIFNSVPIRAQFDRLGPGLKIIIETNLMSPDRIEGTYHINNNGATAKYDWYVVKPATGKSDSTISNVEGN